MLRFDDIRIHLDTFLFLANSSSQFFDAKKFDEFKRDRVHQFLFVFITDENHFSKKPS